ncbi:MAG: prolyl oligopeptidase family serine peptidase [Bowdeniella nasicola]|nr:prolyl oligopeptidase family serine peptidase [Bowdeniella nasicola]
MSSDTAANPTPPAYLDEISGEQALAWVRTHNAHTLATLGQTERFREIETDILRVYHSTDKIAHVRQRGDWLYNFWKDATHERGLWRRCSWQQYKSGDPHWEVLLDIDALAAAEGQPWVWHGAQVHPVTGDSALITLSRGGSDADTTREFCLRTKTFLPDGFFRPEGKGSLQWASADGNMVLAAVECGPDTLTTSGYPRTVRLVRRGQDLCEGELICAGARDDIVTYAYWDRRDDRIFAGRATTFYTSETYQWQQGNLTHLDLPPDAEPAVWGPWLLVHLRHTWDTGAASYPAGALLACRYEHFQRGDRTFTTLFTPTASESIADVSVTANHVVLTVLRDVVTHTDLLTPPARGDSGADDDGGWQRREIDLVSSLLPDLEGAAAIVNCTLTPIAPLDHDDLWVVVESFNLPTTLARAQISPAGHVEAIEKLAQMPEFYPGDNIRVTQHFATSSDGTKIPYFLLAPKTHQPAGPRPTLLYGYGGFEVSLTPTYLPAVGKGWLERGGVYAIANIRGGGEYGPSWHQAALREHRHLAYEDCAAVARDLTERQVTTAAQLGIQGGSNGGLLMGNMLTGYPELFGAVVCQVPLLDMRRYTKLLAGASWQAEYGDPDDPDDWAFLQSFSPLHRFDPDASYPPVLFTTSTKDDRVHPAHARTMAYLMLEAGKDVTYWENTEGGHGGAATDAQRAQMQALIFEFLWQRLA